MLSLRIFFVECVGVTGKSRNFAAEFLTQKPTMKTKTYKEPTMKVVKLEHRGLLMGSPTGSVNATMDGTFTEEDI